VWARGEISGIVAERVAKRDGGVTQIGCIKAVTKKIEGIRGFDTGSTQQRLRGVNVENKGKKKARDPKCGDQTKLEDSRKKKGKIKKVGKKKKLTHIKRRPTLG